MSSSEGALGNSNDGKDKEFCLNSDSLASKRGKSQPLLHRPALSLIRIRFQAARRDFTIQSTLLTAWWLSMVAR